MPSRTEQLTKMAAPIARRLENRCGTLKVALSAGIVALDALSPDEREACIEIATASTKGEIQVSNVISKMVHAELAPLRDEFTSLLKSLEEIKSHQEKISKALAEAKIANVVTDGVSRESKRKKKPKR